MKQKEQIRQRFFHQLKKTMYKKILVTGGTALVGTATRSIQEDYPSCEFIFSSSRECDLTNKDATLKYVKECHPDAIIHLAAISGGIGLSIKYPASLLRDNLLMNLSVLEAARILNIKKTVMTLSSAMYPVNAPHPIKEDYIHEGIPHESNYSYAFAKRIIDPAIKAYRKEYGLNVIGLIPNGIFGENDNFNYDDATMVATLIRRFYEQGKGSSKIIVWGDGTPLREYTYARDIAKAYLWCLHHYDHEQILNIGSTEEHSVKEIAYMIADIMNIDKNRIEFDTSKPKGIHKKSTDNSRFIGLSQFTYTPFKTGLERTIKWFVDNYENRFASLRISSKIKY